MDTLLIDLFTNPEALKTPAGSIFLTLLIVWSLAWKGSGLWHAAKNEEKNWFLAILLINTAGILEIAYLFYFSKNKINPADLQNNIRSFAKMGRSKVKKAPKGN